MVKNKKEAIKADGKDKFSRRKFVVGSGTALVGSAITACATASALGGTSAPADKTTYAQSTGYLVYDSRRCTGCQSCMLACSLVHEGETSASLSRIQVGRSVLTRYPYDIQIAVCRQCPEPLCVKNCPVGACHVSAANGNVRMIDAKKCIGCQTCLEACPYPPHRTVWNPTTKKSTKCDLCADAPYFSKKGGPSGLQACVSTCPIGALKLVSKLPSQADISGYDVNLPPPTPRKSPVAPQAPGTPSR
jgi:protein NrfC